MRRAAGTLFAIDDENRLASEAFHRVTAVEAFDEALDLWKVELLLPRALRNVDPFTPSAALEVNVIAIGRLNEGALHQSVRMRGAGHRFASPEKASELAKVIDLGHTCELYRVRQVIQDARG